MYTVEQLLTDAANNRSALTRRGSNDVRMAWDAFNRYVSDCVYKKQTLSVSNFCKIGWKLEPSWHLKPQMRPHFNISEAFARTCNADSRTEINSDSKSLALVEEFNFSKCALKFSQGLTKDLLFIGLRAIISQLAEAIGSGQEVTIDMEVGTLRSSARCVTFSFIADLYLQEGLDIPADAPKPSDYRPSNTFAPPSQDALSLSVAGSNKFRGTAKATDLGGFSDTMEGLPQSSRVSEAGFGPGETHANIRGPDHASVASASSKQAICQQEAMGRHIAGLAADANEAVKEHQRWETHCKRLMDEEKKDLEWRNSLAKEYSEMLKEQIREAEERKAQGRRHAVEQASMHDYPDFSVMPETSVQDYVMDRRNHLKEDLDQQVEMKRRQKEAAKQREKAMESINSEYTQQEMAVHRLQAEVKKEQQKQECCQAWSDGKRLKEVKKEITEYNKKAPSSRIPISDVVKSLHSSLEGKPGASMSPRATKTGGHVAFGLPPATPRGGGESGQATPRISTGSVRRFPIGAAASLALTKQRMHERGML
eukprot:TRINITY_DN21924_c0_g1_i1.p1 TRINITY_DN21924_c0_g1~~TRINITY_DN21924_c0_g1_i1.p1  ORF type:complete len:538 (-),score=127.22 TRINITY_DN21924_c0_g1_i1:62-1675(-)